VIQYQRIIQVTDRSVIGEARRVSSLAAKQAGLNDEDCGRAALVATELATNLAAYATGGQILIRGTSGGIEIIAFDRGPSMDIQRCMTDGYSTGGTGGNGLGGVRRLSTDFDIFSSERGGTAIMSRISAGSPDRHRARSNQIAWAAICSAAPGETECGDGWHLAAEGGLVSATIADGLGHGPIAAIASREAIAVFERAPFEEPTNYLEKAHAALQSTRGAAVAVARADLKTRNLHYAGVGNICGAILDFAGHKKRPMISHNGTLGSHKYKTRGFDYQWNDGDVLVMHSDGLTDRWKLEDYQGLSQRDVSLIATVLYRDHKRGHDDATVLAVRLKSN
jgi:anti-sigma regulatory factor (Ser/Thr protein kinase)